MAEKPWAAKIVVTHELARKLIEAQFPRLAPVELEELGLGWDNQLSSSIAAMCFVFPGGKSR